MFSSENLDHDAQLSSGEKQLKSFGSFLDRHDNLLSRLSANVDDSVNQHHSSNFDKATHITCPQDPVKLVYSDPHECVSLFQIIDSDNKVLNKILITFARLCHEATTLKAECRALHIKLLYFDEELCVCEESGQSGECFVKMSNLLELLWAVQYLSHRCIILASTILQQLGPLFTADGACNTLDLQLIMQFQEIFNRLGDVLIQLVVFDEILSSSNFSRFWQSYKKTIHSIGKNLSKFHPCTEFQINGLTNILNTLENLFAGHLFQTFLDSTFKTKEELSAKALEEISGHFQDYIKVNMASIDRFSSNISDFDETELMIKMNAICVLHHNFFGQLDQKLLKHLIDANGKHIGINMIGNITWRPEPFLEKHAGTLIKNYEKYFLESTRFYQTYLVGKINTLFPDTKQYCNLVTLWSLQMNINLKIDSHVFRLGHLKNLCNLYLQGLKYAGQLSHMIKSLTNLHVLLHTTMTKSTLLSICKLIEYLKVVQITYQSNFADISKSMQCVTQYLSYKVLLIISAIKKKMTAQGCNERNLDTVLALQIAEKCMYGPTTKIRILIASLALNSANPIRSVAPENVEKLHKVLHRLEMLINLQANLKILCDTSFMYWHQSILTIYLKQLVERQAPENSAIKYIIGSADLCSQYFEEFGISDTRITENVRISNYEQFRREIIDKLCAQIETFLRIEVHANLAQEKINPFGQRLQDLRDMVSICPVNINGLHVVLKNHVENYLSSMFYNLTTIALHDWKTYGEMRHLGNYNFSIVTIEDHLPTQTLEQGIDVLEIMRNIHVFVAKYLYNMNNQIFVEYTSNNKHLNTIGIKHIANSLRTHGTGIINTTINFTYQFLRKKLYSFSQFMFDEHIKSRLMKDLKYFRDNKEKLGQMYSYERANGFNKGIRKFGLTPEGQSYLDLFRQLISQIGNAMGYIRLIRSGGIHSSINVYQPVSNENKFTTATTNEGLSETSVKAAENFESNLRNLSRNFGEGTEYFQLLIEAFSSFFRDPKNTHLRNFYLIIPPLTINFVEYIINAKDKIHKKDKHGVLFVDDGFAIGLAYILKLLNQMSEFNSLHWFKSVKQKYAAEHMKINAQREQIDGVKAPGDDKLYETLSLTEKRINAYQIEFNLLYYSLTSSKIFFQ